jgi:hypothetical protein
MDAPDRQDRRFPARPCGAAKSGGDAAAPDAPASAALIADAEVGIVPLRLFPLRKWYYAVSTDRRSAQMDHAPLWYYHRPASEHRLKRDPRFFELVDPLLRELCRLVFDAGCCTTPSCEGHFYSRARFEKIWEELQRDAGVIRERGLLLRDSESEEDFLFVDPNFSLPWRDFGDFYEQINPQQVNGYVGIAVPAEKQLFVRRLQDDAFESSLARIQYDEELTQILGEPLIGVYVSPQTMEQRAWAWAEVTGYFRGVLSSAARRPPS